MSHFFSQLPLAVNTTAALSWVVCCMCFFFVLFCFSALPSPQRPPAGSIRGDLRCLALHSPISLCKHTSGEWWVGAYMPKSNHVFAAIINMSSCTEMLHVSSCQNVQNVSLVIKVEKLQSSGSGGLVWVRGTYRMSSSLANMMMALALEVSSRRLMILSNSPGLGSLGIFKDWAIHTPPGTERATQNALTVFTSLICIPSFRIHRSCLVALPLAYTQFIKLCFTLPLVRGSGVGFTLPKASTPWDKNENKGMVWHDSSSQCWYSIFWKIQTPGYVVTGQLIWGDAKTPQQQAITPVLFKIYELTYIVAV